MGSLRIRGKRDEHGMARLTLINEIESEWERINDEIESEWERIDD